MSPRRAVQLLLPVALAVAALATVAGAVQAAPAPVPCPGGIGLGCVPLPVPTGIPIPGPTPRPSPTPTLAPGPTPLPGPVPTPADGVGFPTDVGFNALAQKVYAGASWFLPQLFPMLTTPAGDSNWFLELYRRMENIGALLLLLFLVLGLITALIQRDLGLMLKVPFLYLPVAIGVTIIAIQLTQVLMAIVDGFTIYMLQGVGDDLAAALSHGAAVLAAAAAGTALTGQIQAVGLLVAGTALLAGLGIALELLARTAAIYVCLAFMPVTVACLLWPKLASLPKLLVEVLIGLILLKWVVAVVLVLAVKALEANPFTMGPQGDPGFLTILMGAVMLVIAAVGSPLTLIRVIPWVEGQVVGHWSGQMRRAVVSAAVYRRIDPKRLQEAAKGNAGSLPVKSQQGAPSILALPPGSQVFVRSPRPAQAAGSGGRRGSGRPPAPPPTPSGGAQPPWPPPGRPWGAPPRPKPPPAYYPPSPPVPRRRP
jgi:hypothetical protein